MKSTLFSSSTPGHVPTIRRAFQTSFASSICAVLLASCSLFSPSAWKSAKDKEPEPADQLLLRATLDKSAYRPGEAILMRVSLTNTTPQSLSIKKLNAKSLTFWFGDVREGRRFERNAVVSKLEEKSINEAGTEVDELKPGESWERQFLLTRLTAEDGDYVAQVHMIPYADADSSGTSKIFSNAPRYQVYGDRLFERDNGGLLQRKDAVKIASADLQAGSPLSDALLVEDEKVGFLVWWINLTYKNPQGEQVQTGYLVDPYWGKIRSRVKPFDPKMKAESDSAGQRPPARLFPKTNFSNPNAGESKEGKRN